MAKGKTRAGGKYDGNTFSFNPALLRETLADEFSRLGVADTAGNPIREIKYLVAPHAGYAAIGDLLKFAEGALGDVFAPRAVEEVGVALLGTYMYSKTLAGSSRFRELAPHQARRAILKKAALPSDPVEVRVVDVRQHTNTYPGQPPQRRLRLMVQDRQGELAAAYRRVADAVDRVARPMQWHPPQEPAPIVLGNLREVVSDAVVLDLANSVAGQTLVLLPPTLE